jgi:hypothetical protein
MTIQIDMNNQRFQNDLFTLEKTEVNALIKTLKKINQLEWEQLYKDKGLKWESIVNPTVKKNKQLYSFRFSNKYRALAYRENNFLMLLTLHVDHDSAYK